MKNFRFQDILFALCINITLSIKLQSSKKDFKFWNSNRILADEPKGFPEDAIKCPYVGDWSYYYRSKGMQTSTDDVMVAFVACFPQLSEMVSPFSSLIWSEMKLAELKVVHYVDLGCGVGSTLLLVSNTLKPLLSLGVEAQEQSACLLRRTLSELPDGAPNIDIIHKDLRDILKTVFLSNVNRENSNMNIVKEESSGFIGFNNAESNYELHGNCNLITANPPYAALQSGKHTSGCIIIL